MTRFIITTNGKQFRVEVMRGPTQIGAGTFLDANGKVSPKMYPFEDVVSARIAVKLYQELQANEAFERGEWLHVDEIIA